ncbi:hypothetical protein RND71_003656 [Anisodus tanguticus]|uniref:Uncharacterized protein n=1 Tax=Anisodus tanguticus TaxID=243964 RepID=A0AAE1SX25_9SOLA|nr:hypothetical protein RND71_003656 [Anisodus tanguticus]
MSDSETDHVHRLFLDALVLDKVENEVCVENAPCSEKLTSNDEVSVTKAEEVFDEFLDWNKNVIQEPYMVCMLTTYTMVPAAIGGDTNAKNEDKNDEEDFVTIRNEPPKFLPAITEKPSLWSISTFSTACDFVMFDIHKVLDACWNHLLVGCIISACNDAQRISRGIFYHFNALEHAALILTWQQFHPNHFELDFPLDPGSSLFTSFLGAIRNCVYCDALDSLNSAKLILLTLWNSWDLGCKMLLMHINGTTIALGGFKRTLSKEVVVLVKEINEVSGSRNSSLSKTALTLLFGNCLTSFVSAFQSINEDIVNLLHMCECNFSAVDVIDMLPSEEFILMLPLLQGKNVIFASKRFLTQ